MKVRIDGRGMERFLISQHREKLRSGTLRLKKERRSAEENGPCTLRSCLRILNT